MRMIVTQANGIGIKYRMVLKFNMGYLEGSGKYLGHGGNL